MGTYPSISDDGTVAFVVDQVGTFRAEGQDAGSRGWERHATGVSIIEVYNLR